MGGSSPKGVRRHWSTKRDEELERTQGSLRGRKTHAPVPPTTGPKLPLSLPLAQGPYLELHLGPQGSSPRGAGAHEPDADQKVNRIRTPHPPFHGSRKGPSVTEYQAVTDATASRTGAEPGACAAASFPHERRWRPVRPAGAPPAPPSPPTPRTRRGARRRVCTAAATLRATAERASHPVLKQQKWLL